jgi:hypothetical protein
MYFSGKEPDSKKIREIGQTAFSLCVSMTGHD